MPLTTARNPRGHPLFVECIHFDEGTVTLEGMSSRCTNAHAVQHVRPGFSNVALVCNVNARARRIPRGDKECSERLG
jgi:hypothetical protein